MERDQRFHCSKETRFYWRQSGPNLWLTLWILVLLTFKSVWSKGFKLNGRFSHSKDDWLIHFTNNVRKEKRNKSLQISIKLIWWLFDDIKVCCWRKKVWTSGGLDMWRHSLQKYLSDVNTRKIYTDTPLSIN